ncbi:hypothetical protein DMN91_006423, partial [Ooceraea biroi]
LVSARARSDKCKPFTTALRTAFATLASRTWLSARSPAHLPVQPLLADSSHPHVRPTRDRYLRGISDLRYGRFLLPRRIRACATEPRPVHQHSPHHPQWPSVYDNSGTREDSSGISSSSSSSLTTTTLKRSPQERSVLSSAAQRKDSWFSGCVPSL